MRGSTLWDVFYDQSVTCGVMGSCDGLRSDWWDLKRARDPGKYGVKVDP